MEIQTKKCSICENSKPLTDFFRIKSRNRTGHRAECKTCYKTKYNTPAFKEKRRIYAQKQRAANRDFFLNYERNRRQIVKPNKLLSAAKCRAKEQGLEFNLDISDIVIPEFCPILGIKIQVSSGRGPTDCSPSVDRINNNLGYVKGNVAVISFRANSLKSNGLLKEFEAIVSYIKEHNCP